MEGKKAHLALHAYTRYEAQPVTRTRRIRRRREHDEVEPEKGAEIAGARESRNKDEERNGTGRKKKSQQREQLFCHEGIVVHKNVQAVKRIGKEVGC